MNPFISAWDKVSASILSPFSDGFSARNSLTSTTDRVREDFKQNRRLALPIFVYVCKDLQELVTIYRTAVKTACERGCLKESDIKEVAIAKRRWIPEFRKRAEFLVAGDFTFNFFPLLRFSWESCKFIFFENMKRMSQQMTWKAECSFPKEAWEQRVSLIHQGCTNFWSGLVWTHTPNRHTTSIGGYLREWILPLMAVTAVVTASRE